MRLHHLHHIALIGSLIALVGACTTTGPGGVTQPWSDTQTAYVELTTYQAAQHAALAVATAPGLSDKVALEIRAGERAASAAIVAQAQAMAQGGDVQAQAITAVTTVATTAVGDISRIISAQHGTTDADAKALGVAGGIAALSQAPAIIAAIERVRSGYQPTAADLTGLVQQIAQASE